MTLTHILVDYENTQPGAEDVALVQGRDQRLWIFRGAGQKKYPGDFTDALLALQGRATGIACARSGRNALDMYIVLHLGRLLGAAEASADGAPPACAFFIVSRDKDYEPALEYLRAQGIDARRVTSVREALGRSGEPKAARGKTAAGAAPVKPARRAKATKTGNAARPDTADKPDLVAMPGHAARAGNAARQSNAAKAANATRQRNAAKSGNAAKASNAARSGNAAQATKAAKAPNAVRSGNATKASKAVKTAKTAAAPVATKRARTSQRAPAPVLPAQPSADTLAHAAAAYLEARTKNRPTSRNKLERWIASHFRTKLGGDADVNAVVAALARGGVVAFDDNKVAYPQWS